MAKGKFGTAKIMPEPGTIPRIVLVVAGNRKQFDEYVSEDLCPYEYTDIRYIGCHTDLIGYTVDRVRILYTGTYMERKDLYVIQQRVAEIMRTRSEPPKALQVVADINYGMNLEPGEEFVLDGAVKDAIMAAEAATAALTRQIKADERQFKATSWGSSWSSVADATRSAARSMGMPAEIVTETLRARDAPRAVVVEVVVEKTTRLILRDQLPD